MGHIIKLMNKKKKDELREEKIAKYCSHTPSIIRFTDQQASLESIAKVLFDLLAHQGYEHDAKLLNALENTALMDSEFKAVVG